MRTNTLDEKKSICCHDCGHRHPMGTKCPSPKLTGEKSCARRTNELQTMKHHDHKEHQDPKADVEESRYLKMLSAQSDAAKLSKLLSTKGYELKKTDNDFKYTVNPGFKSKERVSDIVNTIKSVLPSAQISSGTGKDIGLIVVDIDDTTPIDEVMEYCPECLMEYITEYWNKLEEAEYRGRKVSLGKPFLTPGGPKKRAVYVKNAKGNVVKVNFGDPNLKIKKNIPARRKSFRARHKCDSPGPRWKARYWSCKHW